MRKHVAETTIIILAVSALLMTAPVARAADAPKNRVASPAQMLAADEMALVTKKKAISTLNGYVRKRSGTAEEPVLLLRIVELNQNAAAIAFRVAYSREGVDKSKPNLRDYNHMMKESVKLSTRIIENFPYSATLPRAYYLRAKSMQELGDKKAAIADYRYFCDHFPKAAEAPLAILTLADLLIDIKNYKEAISFLTRLSEAQRSDYTPLALDRLGWVYYYMNEIPVALGYIRKEIELIRAMSDRTDPAKRAPKELDRVYSNLALFYGAAIERKLPGYTSEASFSMFRKLTAKGELGKPVIQLALVLRAKGQDNELESLREAAEDASLAQADMADLYVIVLEHQLNRRRYAQVRESIEKLSIALDQTPRANRSERLQNRLNTLLTNSANVLQTEFKEIPAESGSSDVADALIAVYRLMLKNPGPGIPSEGRLRFNLAEVQFHLGDYDGATANYRLAADRDDSLRAQSRLKAIASRYESLTKKTPLPKDLPVKPAGTQTSRDIDPVVAEWVSWIDQYAKSEKLDDSFFGFEYESARSLYFRGHIDIALQRMARIVKARAKPKFTVPAATLILDSYIAASRWKDTHTLAVEFLALPEWKSGEFATKLRETAGDAYFKTIEEVYNAKNYPGTLEETDRFVSMYPENQHIKDSLRLSANAALAMNDRKRALTYFNKIVTGKNPSPEIMATATLTSAAVSEDDRDYFGASRELRKYILLPSNSEKVSGSKLTDLKKRALLLAWVSGNEKEIRTNLETREICTGDLSALCDKYEFHLRVKGKQKPVGGEEARLFFRRGKDSRTPNRIFWLILALQATQWYSLEDRLNLLEWTQDAWENTDPLDATALFPLLVKWVPENLRLARRQVAGSAKIRIDKKAISKRVKAIEEFEDKTEDLLKSRWSSIRVAVLNELAETYDDLAVEFKRLPLPQGLPAAELDEYKKTVAELVAPYEEKRKELRQKAFNIAIENRVDGETFGRVARAYLPTDEDASKALLNQRSLDTKPITSDATWIRALAGLADELPEANQVLYKQVLTAAASKNLPKTSLILQEFKSKELLSDSEIRTLSALALGIGRAQSEAVTELSETYGSFPTEKQVQLLVPLVLSSYDSFNLGYTKKTLDELIQLFRSLRPGKFRLAIDDREVAALVQAAAWTGLVFPADFGEHLKKLAQNSPIRSPAQGKGSAK